MLEKPPLEDRRIQAHLQKAYNLESSGVEFLPLGADVNTAVYRISAPEREAYFLKLRKANFNEISALVPDLLSQQGLRQVIPPLRAQDGSLWTSLESYTCILYPFIEGRNGFGGTLEEAQWVEFGAALRSLHTTHLPEELRARISVERFSPRWREQVRSLLAQVQEQGYADSAAEKMAALMREQQELIRYLVERAGQLGSRLQSRPLDLVLCHSDIHAGNLLLAEDGSLYIVDWDDLIQAPKERDLMFAGGGVGGIWNSEREEALFYQGYGAVEIDLTALAYYRIERVIQDIAEFGKQLLLSAEGGDDREQAYRFFSGQFSPGEVIAMAMRTDRKLSESGEGD